MSLFEARDIYFSHGEVRALRGVTIEVDAGEVVALVGANGAGKTTLMNVISGVNRPHEGVVTFDGQTASALDPAELPALGIVQVPENRHLFPVLSVEDNLLLGAYNKAARSDRSKHLAEVYRRLPVLRERRRQKAGSMSGGQQQMLAIGRALMARPKILLLDEPSLGLAPIVVQQLFQLIAQISQQDGVGVLLVEQNVRRALDIASRAYAIQEGRILLSGSPDTLRSHPSFTEVMLGVAEFVPEDPTAQ